MKDLESPMKNKAHLLGIYLPIFIIALTVSVVLKTVGLGFFYAEGYFTNKILGSAAWLSVAFASFFFLIYIWVEKKDLKLIPSFSSPANYIPSAILGATIIPLAVKFFFRANDFLEKIVIALERYINFGKTVGIPLSDYIAATDWLQAAIAILVFVTAALSIVYLILNTIFIRSVSIRRAKFGLTIVLFLAFYAAYIYFDNSFSMNSPIKITNELAYLFAAIFFLYEIRLSLGREKWRLYIAFGLIGAILTGYASIPNLVMYFITKNPLAASAEELIFTLALFVFITSKLFLTAHLTEKKESPISLKLRALSDTRDAEINRTEAQDDAPLEEDQEIASDENQISIDEIENEEAADTEITSEAEEVAAEPNQILDEVIEKEFTEESGAFSNDKKESQDEENTGN